MIEGEIKSFQKITIWNNWRNVNVTATQIQSKLDKEDMTNNLWKWDGWIAIIRRTYFDSRNWWIIYSCLNLIHVKEKSFTN